MQLKVNDQIVDVPDDGEIELIAGDVVFGVKVRIDTKDEPTIHVLDVRIKGERADGLRDLSCNCSVSLDGSVQGDLTTQGSAHISQHVGGSVKVGGSLHCKDIQGRVDVSGSVQCNDVKGGVRAGGTVKARDIHGGPVTAGGSIKANSIIR